MPRRSTRTQPTEVPEGERRVTRRSLQAAATPDKPKNSTPRSAAKGKASQSPSPAPRGRGRGRGTGGRAKKGKKKEDEEPEEKEEAATEDAQDETDSKEDSEAGAGDAVEKKPARGRGRAKGKAASAKKEAEVEKEEEEKSEAPGEEKEENKDEPKEETAAEAKEETVTPKKGRGRRSAGTSPAKAETPPSSGRSTRTRSPRKLPEETPTRRSGRTRKSAETTPQKDEEEIEESEPTGQKRKREDDEPAEVAEKKQKTEETEPAAPQKEEQSMEVEEPKTEAPKQSEETPSASTEPEKVETPSAGEASVETKEPEAPSVPDEKVEPASYPPADEPEKAAVAQPEESEAMDTTPAAEELPTEKTPEAVVEKEPEPDMNEYVMVSKDEIPPADSAEVADALPKEPEPVKDTEEKPEEEPAPPLEPSAPPASAPDESPAIPEVEPTSQPVSVIQEPVSSQPEAPVPPAPVESSEPPTENGENGGECAINASINTSDVPVEEPSKDMAAPSNNIDSVAQEPSATIPDPLFQRQYVANPNIDSTLAADLARKFSVVSYNILADCHAPLTKYPWITPDHLSQEYRHKKLLQELQYLDADVVCLQEVGPQYYENTLKPTLGALGYEGSYMKRVDDNINEGEATFVRSRRFTVLSQKGIALRDLAFKELGNSGLENENLDAVKRFVDKPSVVLITQLRCNNTGNTVTIGNIHVSWEQLAKPDLQCIEVADALKELVATATPQGAFLICGDFNSWPGSPVYQLTKEGYLSDQSMSELQGVNNVRMADGSLSPLINLWWKGFQHTATNMKSAYHQVLGTEPHTTRYPHNGWVKQVDFVWYSGNTLESGGVLQTVQQDQIAAGIPNASFPSDHISLKTDLVFKL